MSADAKYWVLVASQAGDNAKQWHDALVRAGWKSKPSLYQPNALSCVGLVLKAERGKRGLPLRMLANFSEVHCSSTHNLALILSMACRLESTIRLGYSVGPGTSILHVFYPNLPIDYSLHIHQIIRNLFLFHS